MNIIEKIRIKYRIFKRKLINDEKKIFNKKTDVFWNNYTEKIDQKWGKSEHDYELLTNIISQTKPKTIFDYGCGSGRLFPLYLQFDVSKIIGIDISSKAIQIAKERYKSDKIKISKTDLFDLKYKQNYFDLLISNRVLQHIKPKEIKRTIKKIVFMSRYIYVNEMTDSDYQENIFYLFKHDYEKLFAECNYEIIETDSIDNQKYYLFKRTENL